MMSLTDKQKTQNTKNSSADVLIWKLCLLDNLVSLKDFLKRMCSHFEKYRIVIKIFTILIIIILS